MMNDKLMKRMEKKGKKLNPLEQKAKMGVIKELSDQAGAMMGDKIKGLKKVTVASDSPEGLKAGLEKAEEIVDPKESEDGEETEAEIPGMDPEKCDSPEEIDALIKQLLEKKAALEKKE